ncbi:MAG: alpha/beta hydrolase, partial [Bacteroidia bacterium]|nr:alpha/beta hydrolase [Bacteroidia bacterium]
MKNKFYAACLLLTAIAPLVGKTQNIPQGQYNGVLTTPGGKLELSIKLIEQNGMVIAKMDVPAQGAKDIPATKTLIKNDSILLDFAMMRAVYRGVYNKDSLAISGQWTQGPYKFPLQLFMAKNGNNKTLKRQEPIPPFDYNTEDISFENKKAGIKIAGTLSYPKLKTNLTTVILITGSGAQNRDEEIMGHKPFLVIADYLTRKGYAVLRCDDRGIGGTGGNPAESTSLDFATDVEAAMDYLKTRKELNPEKIGLMGHSEGGAIAPIIAARNKTVAFVIMLAGPGINCMDLLVLQAATLSKTMGLDENTIATNSKLNRNIYETALKNESNAAQIIKGKLLEAGM